MLHRRASRNRAASCGSITATARAAHRSTKERPISINIPFMSVFNNLVMFKQDVAQNSVDTIVPDLAESWAWSERRQETDLQTEAGRQMARRQAVHFSRCQMHLRHADGEVAAEVPPEPAQVLVQRGQRRHHQRRFRGVVQPEAAATGAAVAARLRLHADLSLPRLAGGDAHPPDRHRPVQIRRVQGQRIDQADPQSRLLEEGPAASRRHRIYHHYQPLDGHSRICLRANST